MTVEETASCAMHDRRSATLGERTRAVCKTVLVLALAAGAGHGACQSLYYVEPGLLSCPAAPGPTSAAPKPVSRGVAVPGSISVGCGFDKGSYTVTLNSTDPGATFAPRTFIVNFGRVVGNGAFTVRFSTAGVQNVTAAITSNMGSPTVRGDFVSANSEFNVVNL